MSGQHPPISCADFKAILKQLGFSPRPKKSGTSHEDWIGNVGGRFRKVTVDCPKAPFSQDLISSMAHQAASRRSAFTSCISVANTNRVRAERAARKFKLTHYRDVWYFSAYATHRLDDARYEALQAQFADYKAQTQADAATAQKAYATALQAQIDRGKNQEAANAQTIASLTSERDAAQQSAEFARRLFASAVAAGAGARGAQVPAAGNQPGAHDAAAGAGNQPSADLLRDVADSATECKTAIEHLDRLQIELAPHAKDLCASATA